MGHRRRRKAQGGHHRGIGRAIKLPYRALINSFLLIALPFSLIYVVFYIGYLILYVKLRVYYIEFPIVISCFPSEIRYFWEACAAQVSHNCECNRQQSPTLANIAPRKPFISLGKPRIRIGNSI